MVWNRYSFGALFLLITVLGLIEFYGLVKNSKFNIQPQKITGTIVGALLYIFSFIGSFLPGIWVPSITILSVIAILVIFVSELYRKKENPFGNIAFTLLGVLYLALPF